MNLRLSSASRVQLLVCLFAFVVIAAPLASANAADAFDPQRRVAEGKLVRAQKFLRSAVFLKDGRTFATIEDFVLDSDLGQIAYVVVSYRNAQGLEKWHALPFEVLREDPARHNLFLNITEDRLDPARGFDQYRWPDLTDPNWARDAHRYFGCQPYWEPRDPRQNDPRDRRDRRGNEWTRSIELNREFFWVNRVSQIIGKPVRSRGGERDGRPEDFGGVADVVIDLKHGHAVYAVVSDGAVLGVEERLALVPWGALEAIPRFRLLTLHCSRDAIRASYFGDAAWPNMNDPRWARDTHTRFNQEPYWQNYGWAGETQCDQHWRGDSAYNRAYEPARVQTWRGRVVSFGEYAPGEGAARGRLVVIRTFGDNEVHHVHLGPASYVDRRYAKFNLREGEDCEITGSLVNFEGRRAIVASRVKRGNDYIDLRDQRGRPAWDDRDYGRDNVVVRPPHEKPYEKPPYQPRPDDRFRLDEGMREVVDAIINSTKKQSAFGEVLLGLSNNGKFSSVFAMSYAMFELPHIGNQFNPLLPKWVIQQRLKIVVPVEDFHKVIDSYTKAVIEGGKVDQAERAMLKWLADNQTKLVFDKGKYVPKK